VRETERALAQGLVGVCIRPSAYVDELPLNHRVYERFWAACQDLDAAVALHPGVHVDTPGACRKFQLVVPSGNLMLTNQAHDEVHGGSGLGQAVGNAVDMIVSLGRLLMGGVCERFPRLRVLCLEAGGGWIPTLLERMDEQVKAFPLDGRQLRLLPSEYFKRQCWAGFECGWNLAACEISDRIASCGRPTIVPSITRRDAERTNRSALDEPARRRILGVNAIEVPAAARPASPPPGGMAPRPSPSACAASGASACARSSSARPGGLLPGREQHALRGRRPMHADARACNERTCVAPARRSAARVHAVPETAPPELASDAMHPLLYLESEASVTLLRCATRSASCAVASTSTRPPPGSG
jgi:hypothetical protein